ncbi:sigma 54-interacting transcriptional regulator [Fusibacter paucivorans]|uniref:Sigma 54-interacting transcriptional regulator n=1 Tax=Fusibacter paucivorans TaxID=76009 RepID=A0ABS5PR14_9FIRM|nr:sigma 54-interacting transcriptional regulator [Fusibacter paucivorans]MBS7527493.1 sigma 54-interacting transcriptional regulator [Fusibacter paucivorans]
MDYQAVLKTIASHIDDGIFIVDVQAKVVFYNASLNNQAGLSFEDAIDKPLLELFPALTENSSTLMKVLKTGEPVIDYIQHYYNYRHEEKTILSSTFPVIENGHIIGAVEISKDVKKFRSFNDKINQLREVKGINRDYAFSEVDHMIGNSNAIHDIKSKVRKIAANDAPVIVYGETGVGKELVVQSIHHLSNRRDKPFIVQNCAAIPVTLLESILFGTTVGSFTGSKNTPGLFELADGGTLFLDELNAMDISIQAKLLRAIQDGSIRRIGDDKIRAVDVRIIAAMNITPDYAINNGILRADLYYRLNVLSIHIPPLKERCEDIPVLAAHFLENLNERYADQKKSISKSAYQMLMQYEWPGNIRELKHAIEHVFLMSSNTLLTSDDFIGCLKEPFNAFGHTITSDKPSSHKQPDVLMSSAPLSSQSLKERMKAVEKTIILEALNAEGYAIVKAAERLSIPRQTLHYKMKQHGISVQRHIDNI